MEGSDHGQSTDELRNETEFEQILRLNAREQLPQLELFFALHVGAKPDPRLAQPALDNLVEADERTTADEQDVRSVHLQEVLLRVFTPALGRNVCDGSFDNFE